MKYNRISCRHRHNPASQQLTYNHTIITVKLAKKKIYFKKSRKP
jgi:hypothetical protein